MAGKGKYYESQFEEATIALLHESHWQYTFGDDIHRKYSDPLIEDDLRAFLSAQYKDRHLTEAEVDGIVANLRNTGGQNDYFALQNTFLLYRDGYDFAYSDWNTSTSSIPTIIFSAASTNLSWNRDARTAAPTSCFLSTAYRSASSNSKIRRSRTRPSAMRIHRSAPDTCAIFPPC